MALKPENDLIFYSTMVRKNSDEASALVKAARSVRDWNDWYKVASFNKTIPISYYAFSQYGIKNLIPDNLWDRIEEEAKLIAQKNRLRNEEAAIFLQKFLEQNIPVAILKGVAFGEFVYQNPYYKRMNDIDILVRKEDIESIYNIYDGLGYFYIGERISGSKQMSDKVNHVSPPYVSSNYHCVIGTQWGIKTPLSPYKINYDEIFARTEPLPFMGLTVKCLSPEDNLHHLCLHLGYFKISIRDLMDIYNLLRASKMQFDWELFYSIIVKAGSYQPVYYALKLSQFACNVEEANVFLQRIEHKIKKRYKNAVKWKTRSMDVFMHLYSDHIQTIEKIISTFDSTSYFPEKLKYFLQLWKSILWPPRHELLCMCALYKASKWQIIKSRITAPFKIFRVIAEEVGWSIVFLLVIKSFFDLLVCLVKFPFVKREATNLNAFAKRHGVPLETLIKLKEQFQ